LGFGSSNCIYFFLCGRSISYTFFHFAPFYEYIVCFCRLKKNYVTCVVRVVHIKKVNVYIFFKLVYFKILSIKLITE
jgi:hypothetical protein